MSLTVRRGAKVVKRFHGTAKRFTLRPRGLARGDYHLTLAGETLTARRL